jgi:stage V sporulation protein G
MMEITDIRIFPVNEDKLRAFVSVVFDECFIISDIKLIEGNEGLFLSMPAKKDKNGKFRDIAHPLNSETREWMSSQVLAKYEEFLNEHFRESPLYAPGR